MRTVMNGMKKMIECMKYSYPEENQIFKILLFFYNTEGAVGLKYANKRKDAIISKIGII